MSRNAKRPWLGNQGRIYSSKPYQKQIYGMQTSEKQQLTWNWRLGGDVFLRPVPTGSSLIGAPTKPEIHDFKIVEYADSAGQIDSTWIGMTQAGFEQLQRLAKGLPPGAALLRDTVNALDALDIPFMRDDATGSWRLHHGYSLALVPAGTPGLVRRGPRTALDSNPLARAIANGESKAKVRAAKAAFEAIKRRRRREAEARLAGFSDAAHARHEGQH